MKLPRINGERVIKALQSAGFEEIRVRGSHHYLTKPDHSVIITVPVHSGKTLAPKTLQSILQSAGIDVKDFYELL